MSVWTSRCSCDACFSKVFVYSIISERTICDWLCGSPQQWNVGMVLSKSQVCFVLIIHTDFKKLRWCPEDFSPTEDKLSHPELIKNAKFHVQTSSNSNPHVVLPTTLAAPQHSCCTSSLLPELFPPQGHSGLPTVVSKLPPHTWASAAPWCSCCLSVHVLPSTSQSQCCSGYNELFIPPRLW